MCKVVVLVKANFTFYYFISLLVLCGLKYIIKLFWKKTDLVMCNCGAATLSKMTATCRYLEIQIYRYTVHSSLRMFEYNLKIP